jgi:hypothetical protein
MSFAAEVSTFCKDAAPEYINLVTRKTLFELADRAVLRSPVGDSSYWSSPAPAGYVGGHFRRNWQYGFGTLPTTELSGVDASGSSTLSNIKNGIVKENGVHYISNNTPYAERIEEGWSRQAPNGIISLIELELLDIVRIAQE